MGKEALHSFETWLLNGQLPPAMRAWGALRCVEIVGGLSLTGSMYRVESTATRHYRTLTLRVLCRPENEVGEPRVLDFAYRARIPDLPPGRYTLRVRHSVLFRTPHGQIASTIFTAYEREIQVPSPEDSSAAEDDAGEGRVVHWNGRHSWARQD
jgi:hypothetical protein